MINNSLQVKLGQNYALNSAATTNAASIVAVPATLINIVAINNAVTAAFIKLFDQATAPVTGTDTPIMILTIPASSNMFFSIPMPFLLGLGIAVTNLITDLDNTAIAAGQVKIKLQYSV